MTDHHSPFSFLGKTLQAKLPVLHLSPASSHRFNNANQEQSGRGGLLSVLKVPQFDAIKGRPGPLLTGCRTQSVALLGLRLSFDCEKGAPVTSGHALLVSCCVSTALRTHAEIASSSTAC